MLRGEPKAVYAQRARLKKSAIFIHDSPRDSRQRRIGRTGVPVLAGHVKAGYPVRALVHREDAHAAAVPRKDQRCLRRALRGVRRETTSFYQAIEP